MLLNFGEFCNNSFILQLKWRIKLVQNEPGLPKKLRNNKYVLHISIQK